MPTNPFLINKFINPFYQRYQNPYLTRFQQGQGMSPSERELFEFAQQEKTKKEKEFNWLQPLEMIFDLLQRGQYVTANVGEDIGRILGREQNVDILKGIFEGLTGKRKGTWKKTFFGGKDIGEKKEYKGWFPGIEEKKADVPLIGPTSWQDVVGFLADVFLDPTTYIGFGPSKANKIAAKEFAEQATLKSLAKAGSLDVIAKFTREGFESGKFVSLLNKGKKGAAEALEYLGKYAGKHDVARLMAKTMKKSYKEALRMTPEMVQKTYLKNLAKDQARYIEETAEALVKQGGKQAQKALKALEETGEFTGKGLKGLIEEAGKKGISHETLKDIYKEILESGAEKGGGLVALSKMPAKIKGKIKNLRSYTKEMFKTGTEEFTKQFAGLGKRAVSFAGKEFFEGVRQPNIISRSFLAFQDAFSKTKIGGIFDDAVWAVTNRGPIGMLRKLFGFHNPYQKLLNISKMGVKHVTDYEARILLEQGQEIFENVSDDVYSGFKNVYLNLELPDINPNMILDNPEILKKFNIDPKNVGTIKELIGKYKRMTDFLRDVELKIGAEGLAPEKFGKLEYYFPHTRQNVMEKAQKRTTVRGSFQKGFQKTREFTTPERIAQETEYFKFLLGVDDDTAKALVVDYNWSILNIDPKEALLHRIIAHNQMVRNATLVREFKQFGIKLGHAGPKAGMLETDIWDELDPVEIQRNLPLFQRLKSRGNEISELGLRGVDHPALKGYLFDRDVASIIDRVVGTTGSDESLNWFMQKVSKFTQWWRGIATLSPGFLFRNHYSNRFQLFITQGLKAFDLKRNAQSLIGTVYGLYGDAFLKKLPFAKQFVSNRLSDVIAGKSVRDWIPVASKEGMITRAVKAFDPESMVKEFTGESKKGLKNINILSSENIFFQKSHSANAIIESTSKFECFLDELEKLAKSAPDGVATEAMIKGAAERTKLYFFDYEALTEFEQNIMKNIIPFYTWLKKSVSLHTTEMFKNRQMYSMVAKAIRGIQTEEVDITEIPEYMREEGYIPTGMTEEGMLRTWFPNLPFADINLLPARFEINEFGVPIPVWTPKEVLEEVLSSANPLIKTFGEVFASEKGYDFFRKIDLDYQAPAPRVMRFFAASPHIVGFVDGILKYFNISEDGLDIGQDKEGRLVMDAKIQKILENNFLILERLDQTWDSITTIIPQLEEAVVKTTGYKNKYEGIDKVFRVMSFLFGIKQKDIDLDKERLWRYRDMLKEAEKKRKEARYKKPGYQKRSEEYRRKEMKRLRKMGLY
jgi:hypothetical protein